MGERACTILSVSELCDFFGDFGEMGDFGDFAGGDFDSGELGDFDPKDLLLTGVAGVEEELDRDDRTLLYDLMLDEVKDRGMFVGWD